MIRNRFSVVVAVLLATTIPVAYILQQKSDSHAFDIISQGDSKEVVVALLGRPDEVRSCSGTLYWGGDHQQLGPNRGQCIEEFYYSSAPASWSVGFDAEGHAVSKYAYLSP